MRRDAAADLAAFAAGLDLAALPARTREVVLLDVLDTVGCALAGARAPGLDELYGVLAAWGGAPQASVWARGARLPAPAAALANGSAAHALDFDDTHDGAVLHAGVTVVPAALAAAQARGGVSGADVVAAVAAGVEVACRLGLAVSDGPSASGWLLTPLAGTFGSAAAAARALGLDEERTRHALGIAYSQAAGNGQATLDAALTKRLQAGLAAQAGVLAASLAAAGITGASEVFEGARGWFRVYHGGRYDREALVGGLGARFATDDLAFKPYPCCRWTHAAIDAALELRGRGLDSASVERIDVEVSRQALASTGRPLGGRPGAAAVVVDAQFSIPYAVAVALLHGPPGPADFTPAGVARPEVLALADRVAPALDADPARAERRGISSARVVATTQAGRHEALVDRPRAEHADAGALRAKFAGCARFAGLDGDELAERLLRLDEEPDVDRLAALLERTAGAREAVPA